MKFLRSLMLLFLCLPVFARAQTCSVTANLFDTNQVQANVLPHADGSLQAQSGYSTTGYVCVSGLTSVVSNTAFQGGSFQAEFCNVSKTFLSGTTNVPACDPSGGCTAPYTIPVPADAYYMLYGAGTSQLASTANTANGWAPFIGAGSALPSAYIAFAAASPPTLQSTAFPRMVTATLPSRSRLAPTRRAR